MIFGVLAMIFAVSCNPAEETATVTLHAGFDNPKVWLDPTTGNGALPKWHNVDEISINGTTHYIEVDEQDSTRGTIKGVHVNQTYKAVFPASAWGGDTNSTTVSARISSTQQYEVDETGKQIVKAPMVAIADGSGNLMFKNTCALIKVVVTPQAGEHVTAIKVQKVNPQSLTGKVTYIKNNGSESFTYTPNALNASNDGTTVTLSGIQERADNTYYVYVPFESTSTGSKYAIQIEATTGTTTKYYRAITPASPSLERNKIYTVTANLGGRPFDYEEYFTVSTTKKIVFNAGNLASTGGDQPISTQLSLATSQYYSASDANTAINGQPSEWRLLTANEWQTLIDRTITYNGTTYKMYKAGTFVVNGQTYKGMLLFPDNINPELVANFPTNNTLSEAEWQNYEANGAVYMRNALSGTVLQNYCQIWCGQDNDTRKVRTNRVVRRDYDGAGQSTNSGGGNNLVVDSGKGWSSAGGTRYAAIRLVKEVTITTVTK